jgi:hypothetical protein
MAGSAQATSVSKLHATIEMQRTPGERFAERVGFEVAARARTGVVT